MTLGPIGTAIAFIASFVTVGLPLILYWRSRAFLVQRTTVLLPRGDEWVLKGERVRPYIVRVWVKNLGGKAASQVPVENGLLMVYFDGGVVSAHGIRPWGARIVENDGVSWAGGVLNTGEVLEGSIVVTGDPERTWISRLPEVRIPQTDYRRMIAYVFGLTGSVYMGFLVALLKALNSVDIVLPPDMPPPPWWTSYLGYAILGGGPALIVAYLVTLLHLRPRKLKAERFEELLADFES